MEDPGHGYSGESVRVENDRWNQEIRYANDVGAGYVMILAILIAVFAVNCPGEASAVWKWMQSF